MKAELFRALAVVAERPTRETGRVAIALELPDHPDPAEYTDLILLQLWPYASIYIGEEGKIGGEARDRVAGFWRALQLTPPAEPDHIASLLGLYAAVLESEEAEPDLARRQLRRRSRQALLWEHLLSWLPIYLAKLKEIGSTFYKAWGELLGEALIAESKELGIPEGLPLHLREASGLTEPNEIVVAVRSGLVLVRDDFRRAAQDLGLGLRQGDRVYVLKALLAQEPAAMLEWLCAEAKRWIGLHQSMPDQLGAIRDFWIRRTTISAAALETHAASPHLERLPVMQVL